MKTIGNKIKELRLKKGITQQELADAMDLSISTISLYESGQRKPGINALSRLGEVLGVDPSYFISDIESKVNMEFSPRVAKIARDMEDLSDEAINFVANIITNLDKKKD